MEKREDIHFDRRFLNKENKGSTAAIAVQFGIERYFSKDKELSAVYDYYMLALSDCNKKIELEVSFDTKSDYENSLYKLETLIDVLTKAKKGLVKARKQYLKYDKECVKKALKISTDGE